MNSMKFPNQQTHLKNQLRPKFQEGSITMYKKEENKICSELLDMFTFFIDTPIKFPKIGVPPVITHVIRIFTKTIHIDRVIPPWRAGNPHTNYD